MPVLVDMQKAFGRSAENGAAGPFYISREGCGVDAPQYAIETEGFDIEFGPDRVGQADLIGLAGMNPIEALLDVA